MGASRESEHAEKEDDRGVQQVDVTFSSRPVVLLASLFSLALGGSFVVLRLQGEKPVSSGHGPRTEGETDATILESGRVASFVPEVEGAYEVRRTELCVVCLNQKPQVGFIHGRLQHVVCCETCARILNANTRRCPICNVAYKQIVLSVSEGV